MPFAWVKSTNIFSQPYQVVFYNLDGTFFTQQLANYQVPVVL
jgi:hypothetical protein